MAAATPALCLSARNPGHSRPIHQRRGCRHTEYHRPRFFSFHCGSAHFCLSSSGDIVEPLFPGVSSEQPLAMTRTATINNAAFTRPAFPLEPVSSNRDLGAAAAIGRKCGSDSQTKSSGCGGSPAIAGTGRSAWRGQSESSSPSTLPHDDNILRNRKDRNNINDLEPGRPLSEDVAR